MSKDPAGGRRSPSQSTSEPSPACRATSIDVGQGEGGAAAAVFEEAGDATANSLEAVKQAPSSIDDVATDDLVPVLLARRKWWKIEQAPPPDWLAPFDYQTLLYAARSRLTNRRLNKLMLADDKRPFHPVRPPFISSLSSSGLTRGPSSDAWIEGGPGPTDQVRGQQ